MTQDIDKLIESFENACFQQFEVEECLTFRMSNEDAKAEKDAARAALLSEFQRMESELATEKMASDNWQDKFNLVSETLSAERDAQVSITSGSTYRPRA